MTTTTATRTFRAPKFPSSTTSRNRGDENDVNAEPSRHHPGLRGDHGSEPLC
ncbi:hypothetical protein ACFPRL_02650 [Pseudoclavibacter helvolus]